MTSKDFFSGHAKIYAAFRPTYPEALYSFIFKHLQQRSVAWDCATGNGQVAEYLARHFQMVYATDISQQQIDNAVPADNIFYSISKAEQTSFKENQFDLITVGQALHWIDTPSFYREVNRVGKQGALLAVWGYALLRIDPGLDVLFKDFYYNTVGSYWDPARKSVEEEYRNIPFPFAQIETPRFHLTAEWDLVQFAGYLTSWSSTQKFIREHNQDPVPPFIAKVKDYWKEGETKKVIFPLFLKLGRVTK